MDELFVSETEVRLLKLVNAEVDYKTQALNLDDVPLLLENQEKNNFTVDIKPQIRTGTFAFNVTSEDAGKRELFGNLKFRQAMSVAINRAEINEVAFFGLGTPNQYVPFSPQPSFLTDDMLQHYAQFDPKLANSLLDEIGMRRQRWRWLARNAKWQSAGSEPSIRYTGHFCQTGRIGWSGMERCRRERSC